MPGRPSPVTMTRGTCISADTFAEKWAGFNSATGEILLRFLSQLSGSEDQAMNTERSMVERLVEQGILDAQGLSEEQKAAINSLTEEEVKALASIKEKLYVFAWPLKPMMF